MEEIFTHTILEYKQVGVLRRAHGKEGALRCSIEDVFLDDFSQSEFVFIEIAGSKVPYQIEELYGGPDFFILLDDVTDPEQAAKLAGKNIFLPLLDISITDEEIQHIKDHPLLNYSIINNETQSIGQIEKIEIYPQQEMAVTNYNGQQLLIPLHGDLIVQIDQENKRLFMTLPEGLLDLVDDQESE